MSEIKRICVQCGHGNAMDARYCAQCGYDSQGALPAPRTNLPMVIGQAALPVLVGVAGLVVRAGWRLLQHRLNQAITPAQVNPAPPAPQPAPPALPGTGLRRARRTLHIRSSWAVNHGDGIWRQGVSEQHIEIDD